MELKYLRIWTFEGKIGMEEVSMPLVRHTNEIYHWNIKTTGELVKRWDKMGQGKYRYFLLSKDVSTLDNI